MPFLDRPRHSESIKSHLTRRLFGQTLERRDDNTGVQVLHDGLRPSGAPGRHMLTGGPSSAEEPLVTIVVVPRERFSVTRRALEVLYASACQPFRLVYVDGGLPAAIRRYLSAEASARGFTLVRTERYLTPNEARNLGLGYVPAFASM